MGGGADTQSFAVGIAPLLTRHHSFSLNRSTHTVYICARYDAGAEPYLCSMQQRGELTD